MDVGLDKPLPELQDHGQNHLAAVPRRKPVPAAQDPPSSIEDDAVYNAKLSVRRGWWDWRQFSKRKRNIIIAIAVAAICLLALIIGLAVGLTKGKGHSDLPLPTSNGGPYEGDLTYYDPGLGACGITSSDSDMICAVSHVLFDAASTGSNPNANPLCGLKLRLRRNGTSVDVKVVDRCVGCKVDDLDVSPGVFEKVADIDQGRVTVEWAWLEDSPVSSSQS